MTTTPLASVLLPCFNAEQFLAQALDSLSAQTYRNLEILALDDGSTDATPDILERHRARDDRIRVVTAPANHGLIPTLNDGILHARGEFIVRMDADDLAAPNRLEVQIGMLLARSDLAALGCATRWVAASSGKRMRPRPVRALEPPATRFMALFAPPIVHPTLIARSEWLRENPYGHGQQSLHTEDYELFTRLLCNGAQLGNVDLPLITVRVNPAGVSLRNEQAQIENFVACSYQHLSARTGLAPSSGAHRVLVNRMNTSTSANDLERGMELLDRLEGAAIDETPTGEEDIRRVADLQRVDILLQASLKGSARVRVEAARLAQRHRRVLRSRFARSYLASKFPRPPIRLRSDA